MNEVMEQSIAFEQTLKKREDAYRRYAAALGLTNTELWALDALWRAGGEAEQRHLCKAWLFPKQTVSHALAKLGARGLVTLDPIEGTRGGKLARLTEMGRAYCEHELADLVAAECDSFAQFTAQERVALIDLSQRQCDALAEAVARFVASRSSGTGDLHVDGSDDAMRSVYGVNEATQPVNDAEETDADAESKAAAGKENQ